MQLVAIALTFFVLMASPALAAKMMSLKGGFGKGALVGLVCFGLLQITGMFGGLLGPLGPILAIMAYLAAWYQVVRVVHGTDTASTAVFMFWHLFFELLGLSLLALLMGAASVTWLWPG